MNSKKILILGSSKGIGLNLIQSFNKKKVRTVSISRGGIESRSKFNTHIKFDLLEFNAYELLFTSLKKHNIETLIFNLGDGKQLFKDLKSQETYSNNVNYFYVKNFLEDPALNDFQEIKNIIFINSICRLDVSNCRPDYSTSKKLLFNYFQNNVIPFSKKGIRLNSITLGDVKHHNSIWNKKFKNKQEENEYLGLTKLNNNFVKLEDISKTVEFIISTRSLIGEDIVLDCGHNYLLNN